MKQFFKGRLASFRYAFKGFFLLIKTEHSVMAQLFIFSIIIAAGFYFNISTQNWINQSLAIGLVLSIEGLNTAVEKLSDFVHKERHSQIGFVKDIAAGAVTFAAIFCFIVIILIYKPYFF